MGKVTSKGRMSVSQIAPQRKTKNTRFGEIVRISAKTGESVADFMREDIFKGPTARLRRFIHHGERYQAKYGLHTVGHYTFPNHTLSAAPLMPIIALKDDFLRGYKGREQPYEMLPWEDKRYIAKDKLLNKLGVDFGELSRQIIGYIYPMNTAGWRGTYGKQYRASPAIRRRYPTEREYYLFVSEGVAVPMYGTQEWDKYYGRSWKANIKQCCKKRKKDGSCSGAFDNNPTDIQKKFCKEYPTEKIYNRKIKKEKDDAWKNNDSVSDIYFGLFATAKTLGEENNTALMYTLVPLLQKSIAFTCEVGSFYVDYKFDDWSLSRRFGVADEIRYPVGMKNPKSGHSSHTIYHGQKPVPGWADGDPIDTTFVSTHKGGKSAPAGGLIPDTMMELKFQDKPDPVTKKPRYICLRLYNPMTKMLINTPKGSTGKGGKDYVVSSLNRFNTTDPKLPYKDGLIYPLSYESMRMVKIFKRERLLRETSIVIVTVLQQQEMKWYQSGPFKVVMIFVGVVISFMTYGLTTKFVVALIKMAMVSTALSVLSKLIENKFLLAIIQVAIMVYIGWSDISFELNFQNTLMVVEATGTIYKGYVTEQLIQMQKKYDEFRKEMNDRDEEMKRMQKEVGMNNDRKEFIRYLASLPPYEEPDDFFQRTLNTDHCKSNFADAALDIDVD